MNEDIKTEGAGVAPENTPTTATPNEPVSTTATPETVTPEQTTADPAPQPSTTAPKTTPEVATPAPKPTPEPENNVEKDIASRLGNQEQAEVVENSDAPKPVQPNLIDLNKLSTEQIQQLQDLLSGTPRRKKEKVEYHTIELRVINGKPVIEWGKSFNELRHDTVLQKDVMKTVIPVKLYGDTEYTNVLWRDEFMKADRVTCRVVETKNVDKPRVVGKTFKRDEDGGYTSQEVEMYVVDTATMLKIILPSGEEFTINGEYAN